MTENQQRETRRIIGAFNKYRFKSISCISYYQHGNTCTWDEHRDHFAFRHNKQSEDMALIGEIKELIKECDFYINTLYTMRSISKTIPETFLQGREFSYDYLRSHTNKDIFELMKPWAELIYGLIEFAYRFNRAINKHLRTLVYPLEKKCVFWRDHIDLLLIAIDRYFVLDHVKDISSQTIKTDFYQYKKAFSCCRSQIDNAGRIMSDITEIHNFFCNPSNRSNHIILRELKKELQSIPHKETLCAMMINTAVDMIRADKYIVPCRKYGLRRAILGLLYLIDDKEINVINVNRFSKANKYVPNIDKIRALLVKMPILPVFMDINIRIEDTISIYDQPYRFYARQSNANDEYINITAEFAVFLRDLRAPSKQHQYIEFILYHWTKTNKIIPDDVIKIIQAYFDHKIRTLKLEISSILLITKCIKMISKWNCKIREQFAFKSLTPISDSYYKHLGGKDGKNKWYEKITKFNYNKIEKYNMVQIIASIKSLSTLLLKHETTIRIFLTEYIHYEIQRFVHKVIALHLQKAWKKNKQKIEEILLFMRLIIADNDNRKILTNDYKSKKEKVVKKNIAEHEINNRNVFPTKTQIVLLRRCLLEIFSEDASHQSGLFTKFLYRDAVKDFKQFYDLLENVLYILDYKHTIINASDLSYLWFREYHLKNHDGDIQFPIECSLPWMLLNFTLSTPAVISNSFHILSLYNDCAETALTHDQFRTQYLFDEIEGEMNVVFDIFIYKLGRNIYNYYKNRSSKILLNKQFQHKMQKCFRWFSNPMELKFETGYYSFLFQQKHLHLLGRVIDINALLTSHLNKLIYENVEIIIHRFEYKPLTHCIQTVHLLKTLRLTVDLLKQNFALDSFDDVFKQINNNITFGCMHSRLYSALNHKIFDNLLKYYTFNQTLQRFIFIDQNDSKMNKLALEHFDYIINGCSHKFIPQEIVVMIYIYCNGEMGGSIRRLRRIKSNMMFFWGSNFTKSFQQMFRMTEGFLGIKHVEAIIELLGIDTMPLFIDKMIKNVAEIIINKIEPNIGAIMNRVDPKKMKLPSGGFILNVFRYYYNKLQNMKFYEPLRKDMFMLLRECGNTMCLIQMFDSVLKTYSFYDYKMQAFYRNIKPVSSEFEIYGSHRLKDRWHEWYSSTKYQSKDIFYSDASRNMNTISDDKGHSPFVKAFKEMLLKMDKNKKCQDDAAFLNSCMYSAMKREQIASMNNDASIFNAMLQYLYDNLVITGLMKKWHGESNDFCLFWSVVIFVFLLPDLDFHMGNADDRSYFGDGILWTGTTILYLTELIHKYRSYDIIAYLNKLTIYLNIRQVDLNDIEWRLHPNVMLPDMLSRWKALENEQFYILKILKRSSHYINNCCSQ
eukprot:482634_1